MAFFYQIKTDETMNWCEARVQKNLFLARYFKYEDFEWARSQECSNFAGIYFLFGPHDEVPRRFYIGLAEQRKDDKLGIVNRMYEDTSHERIRGWTDGVMFIRKDSYLSDNPLRLRYLENSLWNDANKLHPINGGRTHAFQLVTRSEPSFGGKISEEDKETLDEFMIMCKHFLNFVGLPVYRPELAKFPDALLEINQEESTETAISTSDFEMQQPSNVATHEQYDLFGVVDSTAVSYDMPCAPHENGISEVFIHRVHGTTTAQMYISKSSGSYILCAGSLLSKLTTARDRERKRREQYTHLITPENRTMSEIPFTSANQAALFVCGTQTISANAFWTKITIESTTVCTQNVNNIPVNAVQQCFPFSQVENEDRIFYFRDKDGKINARGRLEDDNKRFTVLSGSKVVLEAPGTPRQGIVNLRNQFSDKVNDGVLTSDITFQSRSQAANFVSLRSSNGNKEWKTANGVELGELFGN